MAVLDFNFLCTWVVCYVCVISEVSKPTFTVPHRTIPVQRQQHDILQSPTTGFKWSNAATQLLISLKSECASMFDTFHGSKAWQHIADKMGEMGYLVDKNQVANKWKYLVSSYKAAKEVNGKSGSSPATCPFYEELDKILAPQPNITPVAVAGNRVVTSSTGQVGKKGGRKRKGEESEWMCTYREEALEREKAREKRHQESMELKQKMLKTYECMMERLINKM